MLSDHALPGDGDHEATGRTPRWRRRRTTGSGRTRTRPVAGASADRVGATASPRSMFSSGRRDRCDTYRPCRRLVLGRRPAGRRSGPGRHRTRTTRSDTGREPCRSRSSTDACGSGRARTPAARDSGRRPDRIRRRAAQVGQPRHLRHRAARGSGTRNHGPCTGALHRRRLPTMSSLRGLRTARRSCTTTSAREAAGRSGILLHPGDLERPGRWRRAAAPHAQLGGGRAAGRFVRRDRRVLARRGDLDDGSGWQRPTPAHRRAGRHGFQPAVVSGRDDAGVAAIRRLRSGDVHASAAASRRSPADAGGGREAGRQGTCSRSGPGSPPTSIPCRGPETARRC